MVLRISSTRGPFLLRTDTLPWPERPLRLRADADLVLDRERLVDADVADDREASRVAVPHGVVVRTHRSPRARSGSSTAHTRDLEHRLGSEVATQCCFGQRRLRTTPFISVTSVRPRPFSQRSTYRSVTSPPQRIDRSANTASDVTLRSLPIN